MSMETLCKTFPVLVALAAPLSPALAVDMHDDGGANYVGVQWHHELTDSIGRNEKGRANPRGLGWNVETSSEDWVAVTKRIHGKVICDKRLDLSDIDMFESGKPHRICGGTAILNTPPDFQVKGSSYYDGEEPEIAPGNDRWVPAFRHESKHCIAACFGGFAGAADYYWSMNWDDPPAPPPSSSSAAPPPSSENSEIVYLSNCQSSGGKSSEMNYYRRARSSWKDEFPGATATLPAQWWEGHSITGVFPDGNQFTSYIHDHDGPYYEVKGYGRNNFHKFVCRKDENRVLYQDGDKICYSVYYCQP